MKEMERQQKHLGVGKEICPEVISSSESESVSESSAYAYGASLSLTTASLSCLYLFKYSTTLYTFYTSISSVTYFLNSLSW